MNQDSTDSDSSKPQVEALKPRARTGYWFLGFALALALGLSVGWVGYPRLHNTTAPAGSNTTTNTSNSLANKALATETVNAKLSLDYVPTLGAGESSQPVSISIEVPTILRTQITSTACLNGYQGGPAGGSILEECLHLSFADKLGSGNSLMNSSSLSLWDAYDWLRRDENTVNQPFQMFGLTTIAEKQRAWHTLTSLTPTTDLKTVFKDLPSLTVDAGYGPGVQQPTYIRSADGKLRGVVFVATIAQDPEYNPFVWIMMGGTVGNQPLLLTGSFKASDPTVLQIDGLLRKDNQSAQADQLITNANDQFKTGKLSTQTSQAYSTVITMLKSVKLSTP